MITIRMNTIEQVHDFIYSPTCWDGKPTLHNARISWARQNDVDIDDIEPDILWANQNLENYAHRLMEALDTEKAWFCFGDPDRAVDSFGQDCRSEHRMRKKTDPYLLAAVFIKNNGIEQFEFEQQVTETDQRVIVLNKNTGGHFVFSDIIDYSMYYAVYELAKALSNTAEQDALETMLKKFIGTDV